MPGPGLGLGADDSRHSAPTGDGSRRGRSAVADPRRRATDDNGRRQGGLSGRSERPIAAAVCARRA